MKPTSSPKPPKNSFQFLGIPPKGEHTVYPLLLVKNNQVVFPISRDPPEGGTGCTLTGCRLCRRRFPISRDPPEGGTTCRSIWLTRTCPPFQFLGIPPKGEPTSIDRDPPRPAAGPISRDPPEGGTNLRNSPPRRSTRRLPISRDPPEGGTNCVAPAPGRVC